MAYIPAGEYVMGDHHDGMSDALPVHAVYIDGFWMDTYEVTNAQYAAGLNWANGQGNLITVNANGIVYKAGSGTSYPYCATTSASSYSRITWNGSTFGVTVGKEAHPMVCVSWYGSVAYANWRSAMEGKTPCYDLSTWTCNFGAGGYRLPTEAEWEKAARGGNYTPYYRYPWGNSLIATIANYSGSGDPYEVSPSPYTTPAGFYTGALHQKATFNWPGSQTSYQTSNGKNGWGLYDMAGNVYEWCNDWYSSTYYSSSPYDNPKGPTSGTYRVLRGGSWYFSSIILRCADRYYDAYPDYWYYFNGFRLALD
ncbi:MAG: SUMF1/EgtB/PvdO family nonheme iron enzyme [Planctomycetota bacterium]